jgi:hypothetical protein
MLWSMALIFITSCIIGTIGFAVMPLGQKRLYEGKVELQLSGDVRLGFVGTRREENVQLREVAVEREAEGVRHIVFRKVRAKGWERGDAVQFVIAPPNTVSQLYHLPSGFPSLPYLPPHLVFAFQPSQRKVGQTWTRQESVWWSGLGGFNLSVRYRIVTVEKISGQLCWVVERAVPKQLGLAQIPEYSERWWLSQKDGATMKYTLNMRFEQPLPFGGSYNMTLRLSLHLKRVGKVASDELEHLRQVTRQLMALDERLKELERKPFSENIAEWEQVFAQLKSWVETEKNEWLQTCILTPLWQVMRERRRQLVEAGLAKGQYLPAPDFVLPDTEGKLHRLRDYKGKAVVLIFFGFG